MKHDAGRREAFTNVPGVVASLLVLIVAVHLARQILSEESGEWWLLALAFIPDRYAGHAMLWPGGTWAAWTSPLTHMAVHGDTAHLMLNGATLLAFGSVLARRLGAARFLVFTILAGLAGALIFAAINPGAKSPMIGASGAISGMMAAAMRLLFSAIDRLPPGSAGETVRTTPRMIPLGSLAESIRDRRLLSATAVWLLLNMLGAFGLGSPEPGASIAWESHLGGYFAGLLMLDVFDGAARAEQANAARDNAEPSGDRHSL